MKAPAGIIVAAGITTGGIFLLSSWPQLPFTGSLIALLITVVLSIAFGLGFVTVRVINKWFMLNMHLAILMPWATVVSLSVIFYLLRLNFIYDLILETPLLLIFSSLGGVRAFQLKLNKVWI